MTGIRLAGLFVGFAGVIVISSGSLGGPEALGEITGVVAVVVASVSYALGNIFFARQVRGRVDPTAAALGQAGLALSMIAVLGLAVDGGIVLPRSRRPSSPWPGSGSWAPASPTCSSSACSRSGRRHASPW